MSLLTLMASDAAALVLNTDDAAQSVIHRPLNNPSNDAAVVGVFCEDQPVQSMERGQGVTRKATLTVGSGVSLSERDRWQVNGEWWDAVTIQQDGGGLQVVHLQMRSDELRNGKLGAVI